MKKLTILIIFTLAVAAIIWGQVPSAPAPATREPDAKPLSNTIAVPVAQMTAADVETFLDGIVPIQLERDNIAGATIVVVKDGQVLFTKGYGYADVEKKTPVSPQDTLFRPGSISKLLHGHL